MGGGTIVQSRRAVVSGGAEVTLAPPEFDRSINPFQTRRADYAPHTIYC